MNRHSAQQSMATIEQFIAAVGQVKAADDPLSEPGSIGGETEHPVKKVDDRLQVATEGERSQENTDDVQEDQGAASVDSTPEAKAAAAVMSNVARFAKGASSPACSDTSKIKPKKMAPAAVKKADGAAATPGSAADDQIQIGTNKQPTGEDSSVETDSAKAGKTDPGSSHPARTDNEQLDGHKYSFDANTPLNQLARMMKEAGDQLCAEIHAVSSSPAFSPRSQPKQASAVGVDPDLAYQAGWELAGLLDGTMDKAAADRMVHDALSQIIKTAEEDADRFLLYADSFMRKSADDGGLPPEDPNSMQPPLPPGAGGEGGGGDPEGDMLAGLGGGAAAPEDAGGGAGGEEGGGGDIEVSQLLQLLEQLGVSPEEIQQALAEEAAGGGGAGGMMGGAGGGGGAMMGGGGGLPPGMEAAAADRGKGQAVSVAEKAADMRAYVKAADMRAYVTEVISRSRRRRAG